MIRLYSTEVVILAVLKTMSGPRHVPQVHAEIARRFPGAGISVSAVHAALRSLQLRTLVRSKTKIVEGRKRLEVTATPKAYYAIAELHSACQVALGVGE